MKKIVFMQLPYQRLSYRNLKQAHMNVPLAAGFLKSASYKAALLKHFDINIISADIQDLGGDAYILNYIEKLNPDILAITLYSWNIQRSMYIVSELKKKNPDLKIIVGGPEVSLRGVYPLDEYPQIDIAVRGEGELIWICLIDKIKNNNTLRNLPNIIYRDKNKIIQTNFSYKKIDLKDLPSPYILNFIPVKACGNLFHIEAKRGCSFNCKFCYWGNRTMKGCKETFFPTSRIKNEIILARSKGAKLISILDANFNLPEKRFIRVAGLLRKINKDKKVVFQCNVRAEYINKKNAALIKECNILFITLGLQSAEASVIATNKRTADIKKWLSGVRALQREGVMISIELISGLPGETKLSWEKTLNFIMENNLNKLVICHPFTLIPSSVFYEEENKKCARAYQKKAPHLFINSEKFTFKDIKKSIIKLKERGCRMIGLEPYKDDTEPLFTTYCRGKYPLTEGEQVYKKHGKNNVNYPLTKILVNLDNIYTPVFTEKIKDKIANTCAVFFKASRISTYIKQITNILNVFSKNNPYTSWNIALETQELLTPELIKKIKKSIFYYPNHLDYEAVYLNKLPDKEFHRISSRIYILTQNDIMNEKWAKNIKKYAPILYSLKAGNNFEKTLKQIKLNKNAYGLVIDFPDKMVPRDILKTIKIIKDNYAKSSKVFFKNWIFQHIWKLNFLFGNIEPEGVGEKILKISSGNKFDFAEFSPGVLEKELLIWQSTAPRG